MPSFMNNKAIVALLTGLLGPSVIGNSNGGEGATAIMEGMSMQHVMLALVLYLVVYGIGNQAPDK